MPNRAVAHVQRAQAAIVFIAKFGGYRLGIAVRAVAAILGGYGVSALWATALALYLPTSRAEAALTGIMVSFVVYPCAAMGVFAAHSAARAWLGLAAVAVVPGLLLMVHWLGGAKA